MEKKGMRKLHWKTVSDPCFRHIINGCFCTVRSNEYGPIERKILEKNRGEKLSHPLSPPWNTKEYRGKNKQRIEKA